MGIDAAAELTDLMQAQETARQEKIIQDTAVSLAEKSGAFVTETDPEKRRDLLKEIRKDVFSLEPSSNNGFQFVRMDSLKVRAPSWLVKGLIETDSFGCLYGDPVAGKSFIGIELSSCIATGTPFYGLAVKKGPVIYLAGEGQAGLARRFHAWDIARGFSLSGA
jgi:RecA-family ATPase